MAVSLNTPYVTLTRLADQAKHMAEGKLNKLKRGKKSLTLVRPLSPEIVAESKLIIANHKTSANGEWVVKTVQHTVGSGNYTETSVEAILPKKSVIILIFANKSQI
ncbi:hypothetical protein [Spartinivicinus poritis]|uniref:Uncharacterized protein n=1 Tax=Spartinivicinus poritis TaxID=2994640 RepID=A0ABT5U965_9GAMM|nr:hypothetical protein [Spartinivicinus sp. A2-2]MDE1462905.1 hypothetical protein [Spartinivicinus sp. A2-2]